MTQINPPPNLPARFIKLSEALGVDISAGGVCSMWLRNNMNTTALRVEKSNALAESA